MRNARCWVSFVVMLLAVSRVLASGREGKDAKHLPVALGMSTTDVEAKLGKPHQTTAMPDGGTVWKYQAKDTRVEISFQRGRVTRILQAAVGDDAKEIQGTWQIVSAVAEGKPETAPVMTFAIGGGKMTPVNGPQSGESGEYRLDSTALPKAIDIIEPGAKIARGIYTLAGDDLKICVAKPGDPRPAKFESQPGIETAIIVLKRQSREWSHAVASKPALKEPAAVEARGPKLVKVSGTVKFKDGTPLQVPEGGRAAITFAPADTREITEGQIRKGASARIRPDGTFEMMTIRPGDGVIPGRYMVFLMTQKNVAANPNDPANQFVPKKYTSAVTSGLEVTIDKPTSDLRFELDKP